MDEQLQRAAEHGDIDELYARLARDPHILERIDNIPYVNTPLHVSACAGETPFAMEVATLRPSLACKLNHLGLSPMHLALQNGQVQTVKALITIDTDLIRGEGESLRCIYAAEIEVDDLLAEFLFTCPSSIEDLTSRRETAVHVAVKNGTSLLFRLIMITFSFGTSSTRKNDLLLTSGCVLCHAKVIKLLIKHMNVNAKNLEGLTALDIFHDLQERFQHNSNEEVGKILRRAKGKRASSLSGVTRLGDYLSQELTIFESQDRYLNDPGSSSRTKSPRNAILVVAVLIVTATYEAVLSPPGGNWQENYFPSTNTTAATTTSNLTSTGNNTTGGKEELLVAGQMIMHGSSLFCFLTMNTAVNSSTLVPISN
ncbi:LOW QUALITY PROTEIN: hypothetical protein EUGRSUZ_H05145 [Eucalyptus grandis]|uniref:Uncharacterized protein n=1 Tax=Eucalyptus grandis TaxID=71139 RepID=A0ACC3JYW8_EUCGR|nr:LOW QUALITY PROTEIN: hypothetical protein EUGRSUZ_H05145 [Eucalyptus grandis]